MYKYAVKTRAGAYIASDEYKHTHYQVRFCKQIKYAFLFDTESYASEYIALFNMTGATIEKVENHEKNT